MKISIATLLRKYFIKYFSLLLFTFIVSVIGFIFLVESGLFGQIPEKSQLENIRNNLATEVYSSDNTLIGKFYLQDRTRISLDDIPKHVKEALITTEDIRFFSHHGIDLRSLFRVLFHTLIFQNDGGGSTITQQLVKNLFPREDYGIISLPVAKVKESLIAWRLEDIYSKDEILVLYLNTVPFGDNVFGIEAAANLFYNKSTSELTVEEGAVLIGMLKANYTYNPRLFPDNSMQRRNVVLSQMNKYGYLSDEEFNLYKEAKISLDYQKIRTEANSTGYFLQQIRKELEEWTNSNFKPDGSRYNIYTDGLRINTTLDFRLQMIVKDAIGNHMKELQKVFDNQWNNEFEPWDEQPAILQDALNSYMRNTDISSRGISKEEFMSTINVPQKMQLFSWDGSIEKEMTIVDSIKYYLTLLQTGVLAMDPVNGDIKAWVGGIDYNYFQYDHVRENTKRQVSSTFKPFIYATALEKGLDPCEYISASRTAYTNFANWTPNNIDPSENGFKYSYKGALARSVNTVAIKVLEMAGIKETIEVSKKMGIKSELPEVPSLALGTPSISIIEMTRAYSTFVNGGNLITPRTISRILDKDGNILADFENEESKQVIEKNTALMITEMLREVVDNGTASRLRWKYKLKNPIAGKTGTTQLNADGWFIGFNPRLIVSIWVGAEDPRIRFYSTKLGSGANTALPIYAGIYQKINGDPKLSKEYNSAFDNIPASLARKLDCDNWKDDKSFFQNLLGLEKQDKIVEKEFDGKKEGFFKRIGNLFNKKHKKDN